jgi:hypothetical protein
MAGQLADTVSNDALVEAHSGRGRIGRARGRWRWQLDELLDSAIDAEASGSETYDRRP